jgi:hypothetical protein
LFAFSSFAVYYTVHYKLNAPTFGGQNTSRVF